MALEKDTLVFNNKVQTLTCILITYADFVRIKLCTLFGVCRTDSQLYYTVVHVINRKCITERT